MTIRDDYERVMGKAWALAPEGSKLSPVDPKDAAKAVRRIWKFHKGTKLPYRIEYTSGNRDTWVRGNVLYINCENGWFHINHTFSHWVAYRMGISKPHCARHLEVERWGALYIIERFLKDWIAPEPEPEKPKRKRKTWKMLAAEFDIELDYDLCDEGHYSVGVFPPKGMVDTDQDPFYGDHYVHDRVEARQRVLTYVELLK